MTDRDQHVQELVSLQRLVHEAGNAIITAASPLALRGFNFPSNHNLHGTRLTPGELTTSGSAAGIIAGQVIEKMTMLISQIERDLAALSEREVADE